MPVVEDLVRNIGTALGSDFQVLGREADGYEILTAQLADIYRCPIARQRFNLGIERIAHSRIDSDLSVDEVVIGGGYSAAVYAATTEARTGKKVCVLEGNRLGGTFATSLVPAFYLNSRNRPNELGLPGSSGSLNFIPNGIIQPADLDGREYQTNAEFGFAIRANLGLYAQCFRADVSVIEPNLSEPRSRRYFLGLATSTYCIRTDRIILATGPGVPAITVKDAERDDRVLTFPEFVALFDSEDPFPFRDWRNVAVIGPQDSGSSVVMALLGQGPTDLGPASFNTVEHITWYGQKCVTKEEYERVLRGGARSLYACIGRYMPRESDLDRYFRVNPNPERVYEIEVDGIGDTRVTYGARRRLSEPYDHVVICAGFTNSINDIIMPSVDRYPLQEELVVDDELGPIAKRIAGTDIYKAGQCADLPVTRAERAKSPALDAIPVNSAAAWRYARPIQRLAEMLNPA